MQSRSANQEKAAVDDEGLGECWRGYHGLRFFFWFVGMVILGIAFFFFFLGKGGGNEKGEAEKYLRGAAGS